MKDWEVSFVDGRFIESVTISSNIARDAEEAQQLAVQHWEDQGIPHGNLRIRKVERPMPLLPY